MGAPVQSLAVQGAVPGKITWSVFGHFGICLFENMFIRHLAVAHPAHLDPASRLPVIVTEQNLDILCQVTEKALFSQMFLVK